MKFTTLNKTINLILSGTLVVVIIYILARIYYPGILGTLPTSDTGVAAISLPVAIFFGVIVESISVSLRSLFLKRFCRSLFGVKKRWEKLESVGTLFRLKLQHTAHLKEISKEINIEEKKIDRDTFIANVAQALIFQKGNSETLGWVLQHISLAILASNYALIVLSVAIGSLFLHLPFSVHLILFSAVILVSYFLFCIWIRMFIFSHTELYWEAYMLLSDQNSKLDLSPLSNASFDWSAGGLFRTLIDWIEG